MEYFYFISFLGGDRSKITVIDLHNGTSHQREQFSPVNDRDYRDLNEALVDAKSLAEKYNLEYVLFDSRYEKRLSERKELSLK
ncbi:hypothetical protein A1QO_02655 [Vibrio genomosp. F10 str. ZF-129]|uniref:Uncharacterized protein n=1 Tax=Vibrio genomosp. F10 str. ZF-129 TaxID=1187848 RepID=A0A1E5BK63_9VIBR|nr:hypothetical protein [Vibrio genomosp. F10]OEE38298.1 hypothetical protein A1QO_02655 [Vibrio genomosp. F10 str. ZF-129]